MEPNQWRQATCEEGRFACGAWQKGAWFVDILVIQTQPSFTRCDAWRFQNIRSMTLWSKLSDLHSVINFDTRIHISDSLMPQTVFIARFSHASAGSPGSHAPASSPGTRLPCITPSCHPSLTPALPRHSHQRYWTHLVLLITCYFLPCIDCLLS